MNDNKSEEIEVDDIESDTEYVEEHAGDQIKKLREQLKSCKKERQEYLEGWQRSKADFVNAKREAEDHKKEYVQYAEESLITELFPVVDSFDMAFSNKDAWEKVDKNWRVGVEYIHSQLLGIFEKKGLKEDDPLGKIFDPYAHSSVESVKVESEEDNHKIVEVVQKGYTLHDKIIRPAKVKVAVWGERESNNEEVA